MPRVKILVTSTFVTPFIADDLTILRRQFDVTHMPVRGVSAPGAILRGIRACDIVYAWFASTYAGVAVAAARRLGRPSVIAIGGADVAKLDDIGYGIWRSPWKSRLVGYALRSADRVLAVDPYLIGEAARRAEYDAANIEYLPTGFDPEFWSPGGTKEPVVLTVAACDSQARLLVKGVDLLLDAARALGGARFILAGLGEPFLGRIRGEAPSNMEVMGKVSRESLRDLYRRASVYCQPSRMEGLPNAVCEAMLCGCYAVCTDVGGMKTPVEGNGLLVPFGDAGRLAAAIGKALLMPAGAGLRGRESIAARFTRERRELGLLKVFGELAG